MNDMLKEAESTKTVNEVQLSDLVTAAGKVEQTIIGLATQALQFSDYQIKVSAMKFRSIAHEFFTVLSDTMLAQDKPGQNLDAPVAPLPGEKQPLEKNDGDVLESEDAVGNFIEENWKNLVEGEKKDTNARKLIAEAFNTAQPKAINLVDAYKMITEGKCNFFQFKTVVYEAMNEANLGKDFKTLVNEIKDAGTPSSYETAMNKIYDFADANNIEIKTV